jgi:hypothetical protein
MCITFAHIQPAWLVTLCLQGACGVVIDKKGDSISLCILENRSFNMDWRILVFYLEPGFHDLFRY